MAILKENEIKGKIWRDISIQKMANGQFVLILICEEKDQAKRLLKVLHENPFDLKIFVNKLGCYILNLEFLNSDFAIGYNTERTKDDYPPLVWLTNHLVKNITTGIWAGETQKGNRISWYDLNVKELGSISLN
jgi:hypothetical protein